MREGREVLVGIPLDEIRAIEMIWRARMTTRCKMIQIQFC